ncbi:hypothetical protein NIES39_R01550 [Arthrospira platensis NIES-39]|nr:hypothetical protein NIES39_R01550 [Arthrospira platensis NIES-39]
MPARSIAYPFRSAIAQRARQKYRLHSRKRVPVASECDVLPRVSEVRSHPRLYRQDAWATL